MYIYKWIIRNKISFNRNRNVEEEDEDCDIIKLWNISINIMQHEIYLE